MSLVEKIKAYQAEIERRQEEEQKREEREREIAQREREEKERLRLQSFKDALEEANAWSRLEEIKQGVLKNTGEIEEGDNFVRLSWGYYNTSYGVSRFEGGYWISIWVKPERREGGPEEPIEIGVSAADMGPSTFPGTGHRLIEGMTEPEHKILLSDPDFDKKIENLLLEAYTKSGWHESWTDLLY